MSFYSRCSHKVSVWELKWKAKLLTAWKVGMAIQVAIRKVSIKVEAWERRVHPHHRDCGFELEVLTFLDDFWCHKCYELINSNFSMFIQQIREPRKLNPTSYDFIFSLRSSKQPQALCNALVSRFGETLVTLPKLTFCCGFPYPVSNQPFSNAFSRSLLNKTVFRWTKAKNENLCSTRIFSFFLLLRQLSIPVLVRA